MNGTKVLEPIPELIDVYQYRKPCAGIKYFSNFAGHCNPMKYLIIIILLCCSCSDTEHKNFLLHINNDWKEDHLKGEVKQLVEHEYENGQLVCILLCEYNKLGFLTIKNRIRQQRNGEWDTFNCVYTYDTITGVKSIFGKYNSSVQTPEKYYYNVKGLLLNDTSFERGNRYYYDTLDRIEEQVMNVNGSDRVRWIWTYMPDGSMAQTEYNLTGGGKISETIYTDSTEVYRFYHKGIIIQKLFEQKDISGNKIFSTNDIEHGCLTTSGHSRYYYNVNNDMIKEEHIYQYDEPKIIQHEYSYDKAGNWLHIDETKKRTISYW